MHENPPAYGLWLLAVANSAIFILFAFTFFKPKTKRDWRSFSAFSAFLIALFTEMYGFPLTIYLLSGWLQSHYPQVNWFSHDAGHLLEEMFGWKTNLHFGPFHLLSFVFIGGGFWLISAGWQVLYAAQRRRELAKTGVYTHIRHPQYDGFVLIMFGFLLQWPTLLTLGRCSPSLSSCMCDWPAPKNGSRSRSSARRIGDTWLIRQHSFRAWAPVMAARRTARPGGADRDESWK